MSHAKVYFLPFDQQRDPAEVRRALASAAGFLRSHLRKQLAMRQVPELHFLPDESIDRAAKLSALISTAVREDEARHAGEPPSPGADDGPSPAPGDGADR